MRRNVCEELERLRNGSLSEQLELLASLQTLVRQRRSAERLYDLRDFKDTGDGTWIDAEDVDKFLKQERASWDG